MRRAERDRQELVSLTEREKERLEAEKVFNAERDQLERARQAEQQAQQTSRQIKPRKEPSKEHTNDDEQENGNEEMATNKVLKKKAGRKSILKPLDFLDNSKTKTKQTKQK